MRTLISLLISCLILLCACSEPSDKDIQKALDITKYRQEHYGKYP